MKTKVITIVVREDSTMCVKNFDGSNLFGSDDVTDIVEEIRQRIYDALIGVKK